MPIPKTATLGTLLRHLAENLDSAVEQAYEGLSLDYRPRYTPVMRALLELGPASIRTIQSQTGITHSAVSQTVSQMVKHGLVSLRRGGDGRERIVVLTRAANAMVPALKKQWAATGTAARRLEEELSMSLSQLLREAIDALEKRPFSERLLAAKRTRSSKTPIKSSRKKVSK